MSITLELDSSTESALRRHSDRLGVPMIDAAARLLRTALNEADESQLERLRFGICPESGLPVISGGRLPHPAAVSPERLHDLLIEEESDDALRFSRQ
jgi:hypothetical protein